MNEISTHLSNTFYVRIHVFTSVHFCKPITFCADMMKSLHWQMLMREKLNLELVTEEREKI